MALRKWLAPVAFAIAALGTTASAQVVTGPPVQVTPQSSVPNGLSGQKFFCRPNYDGTMFTYTDFSGEYAQPQTFSDIYVINADGTNRRRLESPKILGTEEQSSFSPDGTKVLFHAFGNAGNGSGATDLWVYDLAAGTFTQMTTNTAYDAYATWSPDGKKIVFMSQRASDSTKQGYQLFVMNAVDDNGNLTPESTTNVPIQWTDLTNLPGTAKSGTVAAKMAQVSHPHMLADGSGIVTMATDSTHTIYEMAIISAPLGTVTWTGVNGSNPYFRSGTTTQVFQQPAVGSKIVFFANGGPDTIYHMYTANLDGTGIWQMTGSDADEQWPKAIGSHMTYNTVNELNKPVDDREGYVVPLGYDANPAAGSISGAVTDLDGNPISGVTITLYNGNVVIGSAATTAADGSYSFTDVVPGGYTLHLVKTSSPAGPTDIATINRGLTVLPGTAMTKNITVPVLGYPKPINPIATINGSSVSLRFQPVMPASTLGLTFLGANVYAASSEVGPWTKVASKMAANGNGLFEYVDTPTDLTNAFYYTTSVFSDGVSEIESQHSDVAQAANNVLFNGSFETADNSSLPLGWSADGKPNSNWGLDSSYVTSGSKSIYVQSVASASAAGGWVINQAVPFQVPTNPGMTWVMGADARFVNCPSANTVQLKTGVSITDPNAGVPYWTSSLSWSNSLTGGGTTNPNVGWSWLGNTSSTNPLGALNVAYDGQTYLRAGFAWTYEKGITAAGNVQVDDFRVQVRRVGATGNIQGRVLDAAGSPVTGATLTCAGVTTTSAPLTGVFALRNVPTGNQTVTLSMPGQASKDYPISNIGGYCFPNDLTFDSVVPLTLHGQVTLPDGVTPAPNATVRLDCGSFTSGTETVLTTTTDANGNFSFGTVNNGFTGGYIVAVLDGYQSYYAWKSYGVAGDVVVNASLGIAVPTIQIARTSTPPTIDGTVNPSEWAGSQAVTDFWNFSPAGTAPVDVTTKVYALWDDNAVYFAFTCTEPSIAGLGVAATGHDAVVSGNNLWNDDCVAVCLDPKKMSGVGGGNEFWEVASNAAVNGLSGLGWTDLLWRQAPDSLGANGAAIYDIQDALQQLTAQPFATVDTANNVWYVEMAIPFSDMSCVNPNANLTVTKPNVGDTWHGMFGRHRGITGKMAFMQSVPKIGAFGAAQGYQTFKFVNTYQPTLKGDLNGDGVVNASDAKSALAIAGGLEALGSRMAQGDVNPVANKVDIADAIRIIRKVGGLDTTWPQ